MGVGDHSVVNYSAHSQVNIDKWDQQFNAESERLIGEVALGKLTLAGLPCEEKRLYFKSS